MRINDIFSGQSSGTSQLGGWHKRTGSNGETYLYSPTEVVGEASASVCLRLGKSAKSKTEMHQSVVIYGPGLTWKGMPIPLELLSSLADAAQAANEVYAAFGRGDAEIPDELLPERSITVPAGSNGNGNGNGNGRRY